MQCVFSSFSTDSGCVVELVDSSTTLVHYSTVFNRFIDIAEGCITDVTTGQYDIRVYDQGSNVVAVTITGFNGTFSMISISLTIFPAILRSTAVGLSSFVMSGTCIVLCCGFLSNFHMFIVSPSAPPLHESQGLGI